MNNAYQIHEAATSYCLVYYQSVNRDIVIQINFQFNYLSAYRIIIVAILLPFTYLHEKKTLIFFFLIGAIRAQHSYTTVPSLGIVLYKLIKCKNVYLTITNENYYKMQ